MCGRFTLDTSIEVLESELGIALTEFEPSYNIAPTQQVLSIVGTKEGRKSGYLQWGLVPSWAKDLKIGSKMINARSETVDEKPSFKRLLSRRRCLIVADSFYEWKRKEKDKQPYRITVNDGRLFTFAGLWDRWIKRDQELVTCTILTTKPNHLMQSIHDRMPVILQEKNQNNWIDPTITDKTFLKSLLVPLDSSIMKAYPVSKKVNNPSNNDKSIIDPV
ncbi:Putative SOS response-associated peptidase YedK [Gracilibacillus orientalis]|uniref:Abasic site processing protein n=1 Tax=Gracilibacillus orientalis TaxID=334253 RepID=A0A1I4H0R4_9BACI|nr:SOS response-associated peptidase [Gracilibacillus orientalis]SFL35253.1 Putative SOS response-associated peptidase YedK [Gracilibacillus orientalis]